MDGFNPGSLVVNMFDTHLDTVIKVEDEHTISFLNPGKMSHLGGGTICFVLARYDHDTVYLIAPEQVGWDTIYFYKEVPWTQEI
jgi:hypothetical protein